MAQSGKQPPQMRDELSYAEWKKELDIWCDFTDLPIHKQGGALFLTLAGKAREAVLSGVSREKIKSDKGVEEIVASLDELYEKDKSQCAFAAYDDFTSFRRSSNTSIQDYIIEFNLKYNKIKVHGMELPQSVLAYYLLKCANLSDEHNNICKATCTELTYKMMRTQIEKITSTVQSSRDASRTEYSEVHPQYYSRIPEEGKYQNYEYPEEGYDACYSPDGHDSHLRQHIEEPQEVLYQQHWQGGWRGSPHRGNNMAGGSPVRSRPNPPDEFGNPSSCSYCHSIYHWIGRCPDAQRAGYSGKRRGPRRSPRGRSTYRGDRGGTRGGYNSYDSML